MLSFNIARRYLLAKKSTNAINIITGISVFGLALGAAALVLVLSVFNGFEDLISKMMSSFNPDVKITATKGKTFEVDTLKISQLRALPNVEILSETLEETAFFQYDQSQAFGILKGVDDNFRLVNGIDSTVQEGVYKLTDDRADYAVMGAGIRSQLGAYETRFSTPLSIYMPKRGDVGMFEKPFSTQTLYPSGTFVIQQDFDNQYVITHIEVLRDLLKADAEVSALEIKVRDKAETNATVDAVRGIMGDKFTVKSQAQQSEAFFKLVNMEKWMSYAILSLTILLVAFNMVGALWMIVLEKRKDIATLKSIGASDQLMRNIFINVGLLICLIGVFFGFLLAYLLYFKHTTTEGGLIPMPTAIIDRYPVVLKFSDFAVVGLTVVGIGLLAALPAAFRAMKTDTVLHVD
jgi:lipoprotein-releasing system permease protein